MQPTRHYGWITGAIIKELEDEMYLEWTPEYSANVTKVMGNINNSWKL